MIELGESPNPADERVEARPADVVGTDAPVENVVRRHRFVTSGVGTGILAVRFGVPPEIANVSLRGRR